MCEWYKRDYTNDSSDPEVSYWTMASLFCGPGSAIFLNLEHGVEIQAGNLWVTMKEDIFSKQRLLASINVVDFGSFLVVG